MYRYYKYLVIPGVLIIMLCIFSGFSTGNQEGMIRQLLDERTSILQQAYFGQIETSRAEEMLAKVETQPLLSADVETLRRIQPQDMEYINSMEIRSIKRDVQMLNYLTFEASIRWYLRGPEGSTASDGEYLLVLKYEGNNYKLSKMDLR